jgi:ElaB/YqjD/DUF883 family membrane-anchored ribosome-binding protein
MLMRSSKPQGYANELAEIGRLLRDLERNLEQLGRSAVSSARQAQNTVPDAISETWSELSERVSLALQGPFGKEATRAGARAWQKLEREVGHRPLIALAVAAGIGFLIGALNRR